MLKNLSEFVIHILRQVRLAVTNAYATSSRHVTQLLTRIELWLTGHTRRLFVRLRRLNRRAEEWLRGRRATQIFFILSIVFVVLVGLTVIGLIVGAFRVPLTPQYTLAMRYSYVCRAVAILVAPIVTFLTTRRQWVRFAITMAIELYLTSLFLDWINIATK